MTSQPSRYLAREFSTPHHVLMQLFRRTSTDPSAGAHAPPEASSEVDGRIKALETALEALQGLVREGASVRQELVADALETGRALAGHEACFAELTHGVAEGISRVERAEARIRATVRRARQELEDNGTFSPALDAEAAELRIIDGGGGEGTPVQPLPANVADYSGPDLTDVPGEWTEEDLRALGGE